MHKALNSHVIFGRFADSGDRHDGAQNALCVLMKTFQMHEYQLHREICMIIQGARIDLRSLGDVTIALYPNVVHMSKMLVEEQ